MKMTAPRLFLLRLVAHTLGRIPPFSRMLKRLLVDVMVRRAGKRYTPSGRYFDWADLDK